MKAVLKSKILALSGYIKKEENKRTGRKEGREGGRKERRMDKANKQTNPWKLHNNNLVIHLHTLEKSKEETVPPKRVESKK